jgi:hypothetical protein
MKSFSKTFYCKFKNDDGVFTDDLIEITLTENGFTSFKINAVEYQINHKKVEQIPSAPARINPRKRLQYAC